MDDQEVKYSLTLSSKAGLERIKNLFVSYFRIMQVLNSDSTSSPGGGAAVRYEVEITIKEVWS